MSFETKFSGRIEKWDIVAISIENEIVLGFYVGRGKTGTLQYYSIEQISRMHDELFYEKLGRYAKCYINSPTAIRIMKIGPDDLGQKFKEKYEKSIKYLKANNYI